MTHEELSDKIVEQIQFILSKGMLTIRDGWDGSDVKALNDLLMLLDDYKKLSK